MSCGCSATESSPLLMNGGAKKRTSKRSVTKSKKRTVKKSGLRRKSGRRMRGGGSEASLPEGLTGSRIPLRVQSSPDWVAPGAGIPPPPYAVDLGEAMQSYLFGRPTPDGKSFMVASGLVEKSKGVIDMVGGKKKKRSTSTKKRSTSTKKRSTSTKKRTTRKKRSTKKRTTRK